MCHPLTLQYTQELSEQIIPQIPLMNQIAPHPGQQITLVCHINLIMKHITQRDLIRHIHIPCLCKPAAF